MLSFMSDVTRILSAIDQGDPHAAERLLPLVYDELRKLAAQRLAGEKPGQTLQATALVHEAYLRLVGNDDARHWHGRGHFFGAAAVAMRRILVEQARRRKSSKRGGDRKRCGLLELSTHPDPRIDDFLDLDAALAKLAQVEPTAARLVELRVFAGMGVEDAARLLNVSPRTAKREWAYARAWLRREVEAESSPSSDTPGV